MCATVALMVRNPQIYGEQGADSPGAIRGLVDVPVPFARLDRRYGTRTVAFVTDQLESELFHADAADYFTALCTFIREGAAGVTVPPGQLVSTES